MNYKEKNKQIPLLQYDKVNVITNQNKIVKGVGCLW